MKHKGLIIMLVLALFLRLIFLDTSYFFWDETIYLMNAEYLATGTAAYVQLYERPILLPIILIPFYSNEIVVRIVMVLLNTSTLVPIYFLALYFNKKTANIACFLAAILPFHIMTSRWVMTDALSVFFITTTILFYLKGIKESIHTYYYLGGLFFGLSILLRFTNLLLIPILLILFLFYKPKIACITKSFMASVLIIVPFLIFSYQEFGNIFHIIFQATHVIQESDPVTLLFTLSQFVFVFGLIMILALSNIKNTSLTKFNYIWLLIASLYFIIIVQKGVIKPAGMEWEVGRFLLPAMVPTILLTSNFTANLKKGWRIITLILIILTLIPSFDIAYTKAIDFEDGLRKNSKELGLKLKQNPNIQEIHATVNFAVIAYYSKKPTSNKIEDLNSPYSVPQSLKSTKNS